MPPIRTRLLRVLLPAAVFAAFALPAHAGFYLQEEVKPMWFKVDLNGDGYVSLEELCAEDPALASGFGKADYNGDGRLEWGEFEVLLISL